MMVGIGTIRMRKASGNRTARSISQPLKKITIPAISRISETRDRNSSAPKTPRIRVKSEKRITTKPHEEGAGLIASSRFRFCHTTYKEKAGTKKPWEKFGSVHHCLQRRVR